MSTLLKMAVSESIRTLHRRGWSQRRIADELGINRETVARYLRLAKLASKPANAPTGSEASDGASKPANAPTGSEVSDGASKPANAPTGFEESHDTAELASE